MNKSNIEWCDYTWNPITGCLHNCPYCYARRINKRFDDGKFHPTFHVNRLREPTKLLKRSRIFVGSMGDLFGNWGWKASNAIYEYTSKEVIEFVIDVASRCPQHTFIFLTKNSAGMQGFEFPDNCWCGTSVEDQEKADMRIPELLNVKCKTKFVSVEPILGPINFSEWMLSPGWSPTYNNPDNANGEPNREPTNEFINWLIIGAMTGPGAIKPKYEWINSVAKQALTAGVPLFIKDNAADYYWGEVLPRQFPNSEIKED